MHIFSLCACAIESVCPHVLSVHISLFGVLNNPSELTLNTTVCIKLTRDTTLWTQYNTVDDKPLVGLYTEIGTHNMNTEMVPVSCTARQTAHS